MSIKLPKNCSKDFIVTVSIGIIIVLIMSIVGYLSFGLGSALIYAVVFGLIVFGLCLLSFCAKKRKKGGAK